MISCKKAMEAAQTIVDYCKGQTSCQNCIFRMHGADHWKCHIDAFVLRDVIANIAAKRKNNGGWRRCMRLLSDIAWIILLTITPWWLFERLLLSDCERAVCKRLEALQGE